MSLPGKGQRPAGTECCVVQGQPWLRSVHRECRGRVMEPRKEISRGSRRGFLSAGCTDVPPSRGAKVPPGSKSAAHAHWGRPGTWEVLPSPSCVRVVARGQDQALRCGSAAEGANTEPTAVPPSEGNEARRNGRQEVGAPRSTDEAGEPTRGTPWREGGARRGNCWRER